MVKGSLPPLPILYLFPPAALMVGLKPFYPHPLVVGVLYSLTPFKELIEVSLL
jgi:hypothetical protein